MHLLLRRLAMVLSAQWHRYLNGGTVSDEVGGGDDFDTRWRTKMCEGIDDGSVQGMDGWEKKRCRMMGWFFWCTWRRKCLLFRFSLFFPIRQRWVVCMCGYNTKSHNGMTNYLTGSWGTVVAPFKPTHKRHTTLSRPGKECLHKKKTKGINHLSCKEKKNEGCAIDTSWLVVGTALTECFRKSFCYYNSSKPAFHFGLGYSLAGDLGPWQNIISFTAR